MTLFLERLAQSDQANPVGKKSSDFEDSIKTSLINLPKSCCRSSKPSTGYHRWRVSKALMC